MRELVKVLIDFLDRAILELSGNGVVIFFFILGSAGKEVGGGSR